MKEYYKDLTKKSIFDSFKKNLEIYYEAITDDDALACLNSLTLDSCKNVGYDLKGKWRGFTGKLIVMTGNRGIKIYLTAIEFISIFDPSYTGANEQTKSNKRCIEIYNIWNDPYDYSMIDDNTLFQEYNKAKSEKDFKRSNKIKRALKERKLISE